jgi:hypothetical protein
LEKMLSKKKIKYFSSKIGEVWKELKNEKNEYMLSLHGRRQKLIGALNSARIGEDAKKRWGGWGGGRGGWVVARGLRERGGGVEGSRRGEEHGGKMGEGVGEKGWWGRGGCGGKVGQGGRVEDSLGKGCPVHFYPGQSRVLC